MRSFMCGTGWRRMDRRRRCAGSMCRRKPSVTGKEGGDVFSVGPTVKHDDRSAIVFADSVGACAGIGEKRCQLEFVGSWTVLLVERKSAIGPIRYFDWDGPQRRQLFVQWTIRFVRVREPHRRGKNG